MKSGKKLVYVSEDVVNSISEICKREGISISKFIDDALREAVKLRSMGYDLKETTGILEAVQVHKVLGGVFVPQQVLEVLLKRTYSSSRDEILRLCLESGQLYGRYVKRRFKDFTEALKLLLKSSRWDLDEVEVSFNGSKGLLRCVSAVMSIEETEMLAKFIEGVIKGLGFDVVQADYIKGMITIEFRR